MMITMSVTRGEKKRKTGSEKGGEREREGGGEEKINLTKKDKSFERLREKQAKITFLIRSSINKKVKFFHLVNVSETKG